MADDISHFISLFQNASEGFIVSGPDGRMLLVNPAACSMFGYQQNELTGQLIEILIPQPYRGGHDQLRKQFYEHPRDRVMGHGRDLYAQRKDGTTFPVEVSLSTYVRDDERYVIAFLVDITRRKKIEQNLVEQQRQLQKVSTELRTLNTELEVKVDERTLILKEALKRLEESQTELNDALDKEKQLNEIKGRFVSMASHEFRTPLSTILSSASLITKYKGIDQQENREKHIGKIKSAVKHLNDLLEDFLSLGKLDEGKVSFTTAEFDIEELIKETIDDMQGLIKPGQQLKFDANTNIIITSDRKMVKNILINLISNAIKFSPEQKSIDLSLVKAKEYVAIAVKDEGIGIAEDDTQHLFSSFFRAKNAQNIQGTGLGLHIVKRYLDLLQGNIKVESAIGKGTTITIFLPLNKGK